eukprot:gene37081-45744_t
MAKLYLELGEVEGLLPGQQARATFALSSWPALRPAAPDAAPAAPPLPLPAQFPECLTGNLPGPERPAFCGGLQASEEMCGTSREHAIRWLDDLERATAPG